MVCGLVLAGGAGAVAPEIRDQGKFFTADALKKADERIREIYRKQDRDVLIETFASVPADDLEKVKAMDAKGRSDYFQRWAKERAGQRVVNGVYVLICKEPRYLFAGVTEKEPHRFAPGTGIAIEKVMRKEFAEGRFDDALDQALRLIEEKLTKAK
jgi:hypothetical protein